MHWRYILPEKFVVFLAILLFLLALLIQPLLLQWVMIQTTNFLHTLFNHSYSPAPCTTAFFEKGEWGLLFTAIVIDLFLLGHYWIKDRPQTGRKIVEGCQRLRELGYGVGAVVDDKPGSLMGVGGPWVITKVSSIWVTFRSIKQPTLIMRKQLGELPPRLPG